ncbi:MAG: phosphotransferase enzyme family protein [Candidatus Promineifilaceae bacterium]
MNNSSMHAIADIAQQFQIDRNLTNVRAYGTGHINDTFLLDYGGTQTVLQRINQLVFTDPIAVMNNFELIVAHIGRKLRATNTPNIERRVLRMIPNRNGASYFQDKIGDVWRMTSYIGNTATHDIVRDPTQLRAAGYAFGEFQALLSDLPADCLTDTIPNFHHARLRFEALNKVLDADRCNRAQGAKDAIAFALAQAHLVDVLLDLNQQGKIPTRITHNDTKINNLLFDKQTGEALCVTDLDTTMSGVSLYDFGDLVRSAVSLSAEDERNLDLVHADLDRFEQLANGYLDATRMMLNSAERRHLVHACQLLTFVIGVRFLTDHLDGDRYFKIHHPNHNLERARSQFKLVASMQAQADKMERVVERWITRNFEP